MSARLLDHLRRPSRVVFAATLLVLLVAAPAGATGPPVEGSGTGVVTDLQIVSSRAVGVDEPGRGNVIQERVLTGTVEGALTGTFEQRVRGVIHGDRLVTFQGTMTFTGTLEGCGEGVLVLGVAGQGVPGVPVTESTVRAIRQAENTIPASGVGTVSQVGPLMEYEVQFVCR